MQSFEIWFNFLVIDKEWAVQNDLQKMTDHQASKPSCCSVSKVSPVTEERFTQWRFWNLVDVIVANILNVRHIGGLTCDLGEKNFCSGDLWVPGQDVGVIGESIGWIANNGICQVALGASRLVQPKGSPDELIIVATPRTERRQKKDYYKNCFDKSCLNYNIGLLMAEHLLHTTNFNTSR